MSVEFQAVAITAEAYDRFCEGPGLQALWDIERASIDPAQRGQFDAIVAADALPRDELRLGREWMVLQETFEDLADDVPPLRLCFTDGEPTPYTVHTSYGCVDVLRGRALADLAETLRKVRIDDDDPSWAELVDVLAAFYGRAKDRGLVVLRGII